MCVCIYIYIYIYLPENSIVVSGEYDLEGGARGDAPSSSATGTFEFRKKLSGGIFHQTADRTRSKSDNCFKRA